MGVLRILTDRGTEYCGKADEHDYHSTLPSTTLITQRLRRSIRKRMASAKGPTEPSNRSFMRLHLERKSIKLLRNFSLTWMLGSSTTMKSENTKGKCAMEELQ